MICGTGTWTICSTVRCLTRSFGINRTTSFGTYSIVICISPSGRNHQRSPFLLVNVLDQWDVLCSPYPLNHRHLSLHHHRDVCNDLSGILPGRGKDLLLIKCIASIFAAELTLHRGPCSTLQLHWTPAFQAWKNASSRQQSALLNLWHKGIHGFRHCTVSEPPAPVAASELSGWLALGGAS